MISIKVSDLKAMVDDLIEDEVEFVQVTILERQVFDFELLPATLHFQSYDGYGGGTDYEPIEEILVNVFYKF